MEVLLNNVDLEQFKEELAAMLAVCFEGEVRTGDNILLTLASGEDFRIAVEKVRLHFTRLSFFAFACA